MRVVVFGAGAIGGLVTARLVAARNPVLLVGRPATVRAIQGSGLTLSGLTSGVYHPEVSERVPSGWGPELVLLTVKTPDVASASEEIARQVRSPVPVVALQNGLGVESEAIAGLGRGGWPDASDWLLRGINSYGAFVESPGHVRHAGDGEILLPAHPPASLASATEAVDRLLQGAGLSVRRIEDVPRELWRKAVLNAAINPVTADHGILNGELSKDPWRGQSLKLLEEGRVAAGVAGYAFDRAELEADLWRVVRATAANRSSMRQDLDQGRRTEVDAISGYLLKVADSHGIDLPNTRRAIARIRLREATSRDRSRSGPA